MHFSGIIFRRLLTVSGFYAERQLRILWPVFQGDSGGPMLWQSKDGKADLIGE